MEYYSLEDVFVIWESIAIPKYNEHIYYKKAQEEQERKRIFNRI